MSKTSIVAIAVLLIVLGIFLSLSPRRVQSLQGTFLGVLSPFLQSGSKIQTRVTSFREGLKSLQELESEVDKLRVENKHLKATNQLLSDLSDENERLRTALGYRERSEFTLIPARVVTRSAGTWWSTVKIDKGFKDGLESDMAVLTEDGLVGKTTTVGEDMALVLLVTDENCKVAVNVEGSREQGILSGERVNDTQRPFLKLKFLSKEADLQPSQRIFTSGVGGVFPPGILLGTVKEFTPQELDGLATVIPAVDLTKLQDVFVVKKK